MKKVAIGCLVALVLGAVLVGIGGYWAYNKTKGMVASFSQLQEIPKIEAQVQNKASFTAPGNGELTEDQVTRFIAVQKAIRDQLGARVQELDAKYDALSKKHGSDASIGEGLGALKDLGSLIVEAKKVQVEALNAQHFSLAEYEWARGAAYQAAGVPLSVNFQQIIKDAQAGQLPTGDSVTEAVTGDVPEKNKALIAPHAEALRQSAGLAFFGL
jgi:hypothetical protein